jgi:hypothetical protein
VIHLRPFRSALSTVGQGRRLPGTLLQHPFAGAFNNRAQDIVALLGCWYRCGRMRCVGNPSPVWIGKAIEPE